MLKTSFISLLLVTAAAWSAQAQTACLDNSGNALPLNNNQVIQWKTDTQDQFHARAHVTGPISKTYSDYTGHNHFEIQLGPDANDKIEVVYNQGFGDLPDLNVGDSTEICGDYITTGTVGHDGSPDGAIIHWVHKNPSGHGHPSGYVVVNGVLYGNGDGN